MTGKRLLVLGVAAGLLAVTAAAHARQPATFIGFGDNFFDPKRPPAVGLGTGFQWRRQIGATGRHNVRQKVRLFRSGDPSRHFSEYDLAPSAGTFPYYCEVHVSLGMRGVIKVRPVQFKTLFPNTIGVQWAFSPPEQRTGSRFDVRFKVDDRKWHIWKNDTKSYKGTFGHDDRPIHVGNNHTYKFEARSEKRKVKKHSGWSPPLVAIP